MELSYLTEGIHVMLKQEFVEIEKTLQIKQDKLANIIPNLTGNNKHIKKIAKI